MLIPVLSHLHPLKDFDSEYQSYRYDVSEAPDPSKRRWA